MSTNPPSQSLLLTLEERRARLGAAPLNDEQKAKLDRLSKEPRFQALESQYYAMCPNALPNSFQVILTQAILRGEAELDRVFAAQVAQTEAEVLRQEQAEAEAEAYRREQMQGGELGGVGTRRTGYESKFREEVDVEVLDEGEEESHLRNVIRDGELWKQDSDMEVEPVSSEEETEIEQPQENKGPERIQVSRQLLSQMAAKQDMQAQTAEATSTTAKSKKKKKKNKNKNAASKFAFEVPGIQLPYTTAFDKSKHSWSFLHVDEEEERELNRKIRPVTPLELQQLALADEAARRQLNTSKTLQIAATPSATATAKFSIPSYTPFTAQDLPAECHQHSQRDPPHPPNCTPCSEPGQTRKHKYPAPEPRQRIFKIEDDGTTTFYGPRSLVKDFFRNIKKAPDIDAQKVPSEPEKHKPKPMLRVIYSPFPGSVQNRPPSPKQQQQQQQQQPKQEPKQQHKVPPTAHPRPRSSNINITGIKRPKAITPHSPAPQASPSSAKPQPQPQDKPGAQTQAKAQATPNPAIENLFDFEEHFDRQMGKKYHSYSNFLPRVPTAIHSCSPTQGQGGERIFKQACTTSCAGQCVTISAGEDERFVSWLEREYEERLEKVRREAGHEGEVSGLDLDVPTGLAPSPRSPTVPDCLKNFLGMETDKPVSNTRVEIVRPKAMEDKLEFPTPISLPPPPQSKSDKKDPQPITTQYANVVKRPGDEVLPPPPLGRFSEFPRHEIRPRSLQHSRQPQTHQHPLALHNDDNSDRIYATREEATEFMHMLAANFELEALDPENGIPVSMIRKHKVMAKEIPPQPGHVRDSSAPVNSMVLQIAKAYIQRNCQLKQTQPQTQPQTKLATTTTILQTPLHNLSPNLNPKLDQYYTLNLDDERPLPSRIPKPIRHANAPLSGKMSAIAQRRYFERLEAMLAEIQKAEPAERPGCLDDAEEGDEDGVDEVGK